MKALFVAPRLSVALLLTWLFLNGTLAPAQIALGVVIALVVPWLLEAPRRIRPLESRRVALVLRLLGRVAIDIVRSNLELAVRILGPEAVLRPCYVQVPVSLTSPAAIAVLSAIVTLTPGTVSIDVSPDRRRLLLHVLDTDSEDALVAHIKARYEQLLVEIFA